MTTLTLLTRRIIRDENGKVVSDKIYYWLTGETENLLGNDDGYKERLKHPIGDDLEHFTT